MSRKTNFLIAGFVAGGMLIASGWATGVAVGQELDPQQKEWIAKYEKQANVPKPGETLLNTDAEPDLSEGFTSLFNGQDLTGWKPRGGTCDFEAKDGQIVGKCVPGSNSTYLSTEKTDFKDFVFTCDMKWEVDGNTGVMFRAKTKAKDPKRAQPAQKPKPGKPKVAQESSLTAQPKSDQQIDEIVYGPQAEMEGFSKDRHWSGGIYGQSCGGFFYPLWLVEHKAARASLKQGEWNRLTISAKGNVVKTWINGVPCAHWVDDGTYAEGFFGLQIHKGREGTVLWKNIRVKELTR